MFNSLTTSRPTPTHAHKLMSVDLWDMSFFNVVFFKPPRRNQPSVKDLHDVA